MPCNLLFAWHFENGMSGSGSHPFMMLYSLAWKIAMPILKRNKRLAYGWEQRINPFGFGETANSDQIDKQHFDILLQAASGGEARLALEIFSQLARDCPLRIAFVTWTKQGLDIVRYALEQIKTTHPQLIIGTFLAPLDKPDIVKHTVKCVHPKLVVLLETELWPGLLTACHAFQVPVLVVNGRINKSTYYFGKFCPALFKQAAPKKILAISKSDAQKFEQIFPSDTSVMSNIKFDIAAKCIAKKKNCFCFSQKVLLFASVRKSDAHIIPMHVQEIFKTIPQSVIIIAPRHLEKVPLWFSLCTDLGFRPLLLASTPDFEKIPPKSVLIWDRFGDLSSLYSCASAVYVGGAFKEGGQNFLEALAEGKIPCIGKNPSNFHWALSGEIVPSLVEENLIRIANSPQDIKDKMCSLYFEKEEENTVLKRFSQWLEQHLGGTQIAVQEILKMVSDHTIEEKAKDNF